MKLGKFQGSLREFICNSQIRLDKQCFMSIDFYLEFAVDEVANMRNRNKSHSRKQMKMLDKSDNVFVSFESINYSNSSNFNL